MCIFMNYYYIQKILDKNKPFLYCLCTMKKELITLSQPKNRINLHKQFRNSTLESVNSFITRLIYFGRGNV